MRNISSIKTLKHGDVFHAKSNLAPSMICIVEESNSEIVKARDIPKGIDLIIDSSNETVKFCDRNTIGSFNFISVIVGKHKEIILNMDKRYRSNGGEERFKLLSCEIDTFLFLDKENASENT